MISVDSNIPMDLVGESHPHKFDTQRMLERAVSANERLVTDAEVLQEILHRSTAIDRRDQHFGWIPAASASEPPATVITRSQ